MGAPSLSPATGARSILEPAFQPRSVLVHVGLDFLGDGILKLPFLRQLRLLWPQAQVTWLCSKGGTVFSGPLAPVVQGLIDEIIESHPVGQRWGEMIGTKPLPGRSFDLIIDTQRGPLASLVLRRIPHRRFISPAARHALSSVRPRQRHKPAEMIRQMLDLLELASEKRIETPADNLIDPGTLLCEAAARALPATGGQPVGLAPGAGGRQKCWPLESFIDLARLQLEKGRLPVFIIGPAEEEWLPTLREAVPQAWFPLQDPALTSQVPRSPLLTVAVCRQLAAVVCNDSGVGHLSAASGAPVILLYGPTSPRKFAPLSSRRTILEALTFGSREMAVLPLPAVSAALEECLARPAITLTTSL